MAELDPITIFHEPINIRAENVTRIKACADLNGIRLRTEVFHTREAWQDYAIEVPTCRASPNICRPDKKPDKSLQIAWEGGRYSIPVMKPYNCFYALVAFAICGAFGSASAQPQTLSDEARRQIRALHDEKESRTPAQRKMDSQLIYAAKQNRGQAIAANVPLLKHTAKLQADGRVLVDIKANVTDPLLQALRDAGGEVVNSHPQFQAVRALIPIAKMETLAALTDVSFIRPADEFEVSIGSLNTEGDTTHAAATARTSYGVNGTGIKVGVLSDSVDGLAASQASGDLGTVTILPGQGSSGTGEGTALLEIIHDLVPGAQLYFATGNGGQANFANNILNLRAAGCDIIVDDLMYLSEPPFQDGVIGQAVNSVTPGGGL